MEAGAACHSDTVATTVGQDLPSNPSPFPPSWAECTRSLLLERVGWDIQVQLSHVRLHLCGGNYWLQQQLTCLWETGEMLFVASRTKKGIFLPVSLVGQPGQSGWVRATLPVQEGKVRLRGRSACEFMNCELRKWCLLSRNLTSAPPVLTQFLAQCSSSCPVFEKAQVRHREVKSCPKITSAIQQSLCQS